MSRSLSIAGGGGQVRTQSMSGPPTQDFVKVAVLPPRLPTNMAPPTGLGPAEAMAWDEAVNWTHNEKLNQPEPSSSKKFLRGIGLSGQRKKKNEDAPPFIFREVPYDIWRKHYAKDAEGRYKGTLAPAEDCLLLPEDVERWRLGPAETKGDLWTRGKAALPVYDQVEDNGLPAYSQTPQPASNESSLAPPAPVERQSSTASFTADGKTSQQIIEEAKAKKAAGGYKMSWKERAKRATEYTMMGS